MSKPGTATEKCINILLEEVQQAFAWSRPSILVAVHQSKIDQARAIAAISLKLTGHEVKIVDVIPGSGSINVLETMLQETDPQDAVFFVHGMGGQMQAYTGLNVFRELIVERQIKTIFWLTRDELNLLARHAPDFWAFRHRVVEFPAGRSSRKKTFPSGALLWRIDGLVLDEDSILEKITFHEELIQNLSQRNETTAGRLSELENLSYYYWLLGENQKVESLITHALESSNLGDLKDQQSMLLNVRAINDFDLGNFRSALQWVEQALILSPDQGLLWSNHGIICRSAGQARKSFPSLRKSVRISPTSFKSWGALGFMYMYLGRYASAIPCFDKARSLQPDYVQFHLALAVCHKGLGNLDGLNTCLYQISDITNENDYLSACRSGLLGDTSGGLAQLREWVISKRIPPILLYRDPILYFIFGVDSLQNLLLDSDISSHSLAGK